MKILIAKVPQLSDLNEIHILRMRWQKKGLFKMKRQRKFFLGCEKEWILQLIYTVPAGMNQSPIRNKRGDSVEWIRLKEEVNSLCEFLSIQLLNFFNLIKIWGSLKLWKSWNFVSENFLFTFLSILIFLVSRMLNKDSFSSIVHRLLGVTSTSSTSTLLRKNVILS